MTRFRWPTFLSGFIALSFSTMPVMAAPPDIPKLLERIGALEALVATLQTQLDAETAARIAADTVETDARTAADIALTANQNDEITARQAADANLQSSINSASIPGLGQYVTVTEVDGLPRIVFHDVNIQLINGIGYTYSVNGKGNLIIGYDEPYFNWDTGIKLTDKTGSHNLVIGGEHTYSSSGGLVAGFHNTLNDEAVTVSGGAWNTASAPYSSVSGGIYNFASGYYSSVCGGQSNDAGGQASSIHGGWAGTANGNVSTVVGGIFNTASGEDSTVCGGQENNASGKQSSVLGGLLNAASGQLSTVIGGRENTASGVTSTVRGGAKWIASGENEYVP